MKSKNYPLAGLIILAIPAIFVSLMLYTRNNDSDVSDRQVSLTGITASDQIKGNPDSTIELIEYSDFQCPACAGYYPYVKEIIAEYGDKIKFAYRHFPLQQHLNAPLAARAAESAGKQNKFWEMHDLLFENQSSWSNNSKPGDIFIGFASQLNLDVEKFQKDIGSEEIKNKVNNDLKGGLKEGVNSTPTFFLNGKMLNPNEMNPQKLKEQIYAAIKNQ